jgi:hypothetical protein
VRLTTVGPWPPYAAGRTSAHSSPRYRRRERLPSVWADTETRKEKRPTDDSELHCLASKRRSISHRQLSPSSSLTPFGLAQVRCLVSSRRGRESGIWRHGPDGHRPVARMWRGGSTNVHGFSSATELHRVPADSIAVDCILCGFQLPTTASLNKPA